MSSIGDSFFTSVTLLLEGDSFNDLSDNVTSFKTNGISITNQYPSLVGSSFLFAQGLSGQPFVIQSNPAQVIPAGMDFTIELTAYCEPNLVGSALYSNRTNTGVANGIIIGIDPSGYPFVRATSQGVTEVIINASTPVTLNALHAFCLVRASGIWSLYIDGILYQDGSHNNNWPGSVDCGPNTYLGCDPYTAPFIGAISQVRTTFGVARYLGQYQVSTLPFTSFVTNSTVAFGNLSNNVATVGQKFNATIQLTNTETATISAVNGSMQPVGSNWTISKTSAGNPSVWTISGTANTTVANFNLVITASNPVSIGGLSATASFQVINTANGSLATEQSLLNGIPGLSLWLDVSDSTTLVSDQNNINLITLIDKANGTVFNAVANQPAPTIDTGSFLLPAVKFNSNAASGIVPTNPIPVTDAASNGTIFLVGIYNGTQVGQGSGCFQMSYMPSNVLSNGTASWGLVANTTGTSNAAVVAYDNLPTQDANTTLPVIVPGQKFLVVWETSSNNLSIYINQVLVSTTKLLGNASVWSSINSAIGFIGGAQSPNGAFISMAELIAFNKTLNSQNTEIIESYLNHKWNIYPLVPFAEAPTNTIGYVGQVYEGLITVIDATSASISVTGGTNWAFTLANTTQPPVYRVTGLMPTTVGKINLTVNTLNGAIAGSDTFTINVLAVPQVSVINSPYNLQCQSNVQYASYVEIINASTVTVSASAGSNWAIVNANDPSNPNTYIITGTMPVSLITFTLTITATLNVVGQNPVITSANYQIQTTSAAPLYPTQYPLDLTGLLPSNLIVDESQTLTLQNGPNRQIIAPIMGPFFGSSLVVKYYDASLNEITATPNVDYTLVYEYEDISVRCVSPVYGGISFSNLSISGPILLTYQTLGGNFSFNKQSALLQLFNDTTQVKFIDWAAVTNKPTYYPVSAHSLNVQKNTVGYLNTAKAINNLTTAITYPPQDADLPAFVAHAINYNNPHNVTAAQIGLGNVLNYPLATDAVAMAGTSSTSYLTPKTAFEAITSTVGIATPTSFGVTLLNVNNNAGDSTDATKALTGSGLISMLNQSTSNPLQTWVATNVIPTQQAVQTSPSTLVFPIWWKGVKYNNITQFKNAIQTYTGLTSIVYNAATSTFFFPQGITVPDLTTSQTANPVNPMRSMVNQPVSYAMLVTA